MDLQMEKLDLVPMLINTDFKSVLDKVRGILAKSAVQDETQYLLSSEANRKHLAQHQSTRQKVKARLSKQQRFGNNTFTD
jgi:hypothetical protein